MATSQPLRISEYELDHDHNHAVVPQHADNIFPQVQPTDNPYHWETVVTNSDKIILWVKASWSRTNEVIRRRAGAPLKRNSAVRRSDGKRTALITVGKTKLTMNTSATSGHLKMHRSFSFETEEYKESSITVKEQEEKEFLDRILINGARASTREKICNVPLLAPSQKYWVSRSFLRLSGRHIRVFAQTVILGTYRSEIEFLNPPKGVHCMNNRCL